MKVGVSKAKVTPRVGTALSGYRARSGVSEGIHDDLYSRAIAIEGAEDAVILIAVDVLALSSQFTRGIGERIAEATSLRPGNIVIAATHTHSGPQTIQTFFNADVALDAGYMTQLSSAIVQSGVEAWQRRTPARVGVGACQIAGLGANRRRPDDGDVDREAAIIRADRPDGSPMAVVVVYGCHPTVLGVGNLQITADFPAAAMETLERQWGEGTFALFFNGAEGDVSIGRSSALSAIGVQTQGRTFERAWELGRGLATDVLRELPAISTSAATTIRVAAYESTCRGAELSSTAELQQSIEDVRRQVRQISAADRGTPAAARILVEEVYAEARYNNARQLETMNHAIPVTMYGVRIGEAMFLGIPAEVFTETGLAIKSSIYRNAFVVGLANGYIGYLPTPEAYPEGGYEVEVSMCAPDTEHRLIEGARALQSMLFPEPKGSIREGN